MNCGVLSSEPDFSVKVSMDCWICGEPATTREHRVKASDIRTYFGEFSQKSPLYFHTSERKNIPVGSVKSDKFKFESKLCNACNSSLTQPHDKAWEKLSAYLQGNFPRISRVRRIDLSRVFPGATRRSLLNVHLFFLKLFGCIIAEHDVPIDLAPFANALRNGTAHPNVHLAFGPRMGLTRHKFACMTPIQALNKDGVPVFASWLYIVGEVAVDVIYSTESQFMQVIRDSWHPNTASKTLRLSNFKHDLAFHRSVRALQLTEA